MTKLSKVKPNFIFSISNKNFLAYFSRYGEVEEVVRPINKEKNENKPFCFVTFRKDGIMGKCVKGLLNRERAFRTQIGLHYFFLFRSIWVPEARTTGSEPLAYPNWSE